MIPQHQLHEIRMQVHLAVHPLRHRIAVQGRVALARDLAEAVSPEMAGASAVFARWCMPAGAQAPAGSPRSVLGAPAYRR